MGASRRSLHRWLLALVCLVGLRIAVPVDAASADDRVTLQLKWTHAFQFAGYYVARELGYYRDVGLDVRIEEGSATVDPTARVLEGAADFGVGTSTLLLDRAAGRPVVALSVIFQHSPQILLARHEGAPPSVRGLAGRRILVEAQSDELDALLEREGVGAGRFKRVTGDHDVGRLIRGDVDAMSAYSTCEPYLLDRAGIPYSTFTPRATGIDFYGDTLFTTEKQVTEHPRRVQAFIAASLRGWNYAMTHREEVAELILERYSRRQPRDFLLFEARRMAPLVEPSVVEIGHMNPRRWQSIADTYADLGRLPRGFSTAGFVYRPGPEPGGGGHLAFLAGAGGLIVIISAVALYVAAINRRLRRSLADSARARAELDESETMYRTLAELSPVGVYIFQEGRFVSVNPALAHMTGYTREELLATDGLPFLSADRLEAARDVPEITTTGGGAIRGRELKFRTRSGEDRLARVMSRAIAFRGQPATFGTVIDVTEDQQAVQAEKARNRVLELLARGSSEGAIIDAVARGIEEQDPGVKATVLLLDDEGRRFCTIAAPQLPASYVDALLGQEIVDGAGPSMTAAFQGRRVVDDDLVARVDRLPSISPVITSEGLAACWAEPVRSTSGCVVGVVAVYHREARHPSEGDIWLLEQSANLVSIALELASSARALRTSEERYRLLAENASDVIWTMDLEGRFTYISPSVERLRGFTVAEAMQRKIEEEITPEGFEQYLRDFAHVQSELAAGRRFPPLAREYEHPCKDGSRVWVEITSSGIYGPSGECLGLVNVSRDITKRKKAERDLIETNRELGDLNREKNHLLGMAAHDLRNPLVASLSCIEFLLDEGAPLEPDRRLLLENVRRSTRFMIDLLGDILDISRIESGEVRLDASHQDLGLLVRYTVELNRILAERKHIELALQVEEELPSVFCDEQKITQVLDSLISNAIKFSGPDTCVRISLGRRGDGVLVSVADEGPGIRAEEMGLLFKPFSRASSSSAAVEDGAGLGLFICRRLVDAHRGEIRATSEVGVGSTFSFTLPLTPLPGDAVGQGSRVR